MEGYRTTYLLHSPYIHPSEGPPSTSSLFRGKRCQQKQFVEAYEHTHSGENPTCSALLMPPLRGLHLFSLEPLHPVDLNCISGPISLKSKKPIGDFWKERKQNEEGRRREKGRVASSCPTLLFQSISSVTAIIHIVNKRQSSSYSITQHHVWQSSEMLIIGLTIKSVTRKLRLFFPAVLPRTTLYR